MVLFVFKRMLWKVFLFLNFFSIFSFSAKSFVLTSVSPHWEQQAQNAQIPTGHNPVGIKYRSLWDMSSQEQEELCWGAGVHMDLSALYAYAGHFPADFPAASYPSPFRWELTFVFLCWPSP